MIKLKNLNSEIEKKNEKYVPEKSSQIKYVLVFDTGFVLCGSKINFEYF